MEPFQFFETFMDGSSMHLLTVFPMCDRTSRSYISFVFVSRLTCLLSMTPSPHRNPASAETSRENFRNAIKGTSCIIQSLYTDISYVINSHVRSLQIILEINLNNIKLVFYETNKQTNYDKMPT